jgi:diguanylate cyclase (GGDEF)-like protein
MPWQRLKTDFRFALVTLFGALTSLFLLPIAVYRFVTGAVVTAAIDVLVVIVILACVRYVWRGGSVERAGAVAIAIGAIGVVAVARLVGLAGLLWAYPVVAASFLLVRPQHAVIGSTAMILAIAVLGTGFDSAYTRVAFAITALTVGLFAYIFAHRTETQRAQLELLATRDPLTAASNRRAMEQELPIAIETSRRTRVPVSLAVLDIDHFKRINDGYGHEAGDRVLVEFARIVGDSTRRGDRLFRYGGEEFVLLLPGIDTAGLAALADALRERVADAVRVEGRPVTVSIGAAELAADETAHEWLARADAAMYRAKHEGRDRALVIEAPPPSGVSGLPRHRHG